MLNFTPAVTGHGAERTVHFLFLFLKETWDRSGSLSDSLIRQSFSVAGGGAAGEDMSLIRVGNRGEEGRGPLTGGGELMGACVSVRTVSCVWPLFCLAERFVRSCLHFCPCFLSRSEPVAVYPTLTGGCRTLMTGQPCSCCPLSIKYTKTPKPFLHLS